LLEIRTDADDDEVVNWILLVFQLTSRQLTSRPRTFQARPSQASIQLLLTEEPQAFWPVGDIFTIKISSLCAHAALPETWAERSFYESGN